MGKITNNKPNVKCIKKNKNIIKCPLCNCIDMSVIEKINSSNINRLYKIKYDYDVNNLITNDVISLYKCNNCHLKIFYPSKPGDENFYNRLQFEKEYYLAEKQEYDYVKKYFSDDKDVLEIGAGNGAFLKIIQFNSYTGLEKSKNAIDLAKKGNIALFHQSIQDFAKNQPSKYDFVVSFQVLEHVNIVEIKSFIESAIDVLKTGGNLIISVPADDSFVGNISNMTLNLPPHHLSRWSDKTFEKMEKIFNLKIIAIYNDYLREKNYDAYLSQSIKDVFNIENKIVKEKSGIVEKIIRKIIKLTNKKIKNKLIKFLSPRGHSITIVFEKL